MWIIFSYYFVPFFCYNRSRAEKKKTFKFLIQWINKLLWSICQNCSTVNAKRSARNGANIFDHICIFLQVFECTLSYGHRTRPGWQRSGTKWSATTIANTLCAHAFSGRILAYTYMKSAQNDACRIKYFYGECYISYEQSIGIIYYVLFFILTRLLCILGGTLLPCLCICHSCSEREWGNIQNSPHCSHQFRKFHISDT